MLDNYFIMLKALLRITDDTYDNLLKIFLEIATQSVLNYINRTVLPPELYLVVVQIAADSFSVNDVMMSEVDTESDKHIESVGMAGATIKFGISSAKADMLKAKLEDRIKRTHELNQFRSLFRVVGETDNSVLPPGIMSAYFEVR